MRKKKNSFKNIYLGQPVEMTSRVSINTTLETVQGVVSTDHPVTIVGFLEHIDNEFYHLSDFPGEITQSVRKSEILHVALVKQKTIADELMNSISPPKNSMFN